MYQISNKYTDPRIIEIHTSIVLKCNMFIHVQYYICLPTYTTQFRMFRLQMFSSFSTNGSIGSNWVESGNIFVEFVVPTYVPIIDIFNRARGAIYLSNNLKRNKSLSIYYFFYDLTGFLTHLWLCYVNVFTNTYLKTNLKTSNIMLNTF